MILNRIWFILKQIEYKPSIFFSVLPDCDCVGDFQYLSYSQFYQRCIAFGRGLVELGLNQSDIVGIYSHNSIWWQTVAFGYYSVGLIVYDSLGKDAAKYIVNHSDCKIIDSSLYKFQLACQLTHECPDISHIVLMNDKIPQEIQCPFTVTTCSNVY